MIYTVASTLPEQHGGRTKSLLSRIKLLQTELGIESTILTTNYNIDYPDIYKNFKSIGTLHENTKIENIYEWLSDYKLYYINKTRFKKQEVSIQTNFEIEGYRSEFIDDNIIRYFKGKEYVLYREFLENSNILKFEDFMSPISKKRLERRKYNKYGYLHQIIRYHPKDYHKISEEYYDALGDVYCIKYFDNRNNETRLELIELLKDKRPYKFFSNEKDLFQYYFEKKFKKGDIVFNDARLLDRPLLLNKKETKNIIVFHNPHHSGVDKKIRNSYKFSLKNSDKVSSYLLLTEHQKEDIQKEYNIPKEKFNIIPHFIESTDYIHRTPKDQFLFVGRFGKQKQLDHLIKAYKIFRDAGYKDNLVLYGMDEENQLSMIENLIDDLGLKDFVEIHGFTNDLNKIFAESKASLLTSAYEGFGLTVMESINAGCPVVSYDVTYGPREIIDVGINGYLVEPQNINAFAEAMMKMSESPLQDVSINPKLYKTSAIENYKSLFENLNSYRNLSSDYVVALQDISVYVDKDSTNELPQKIKAGTKIKIAGITETSRGIYKLITDSGHILTANKNLVREFKNQRFDGYISKVPRKVRVKRKCKIYSSPTFENPALTTIEPGEEFYIEDIAYSPNLTPRLKIDDNRYMTANLNFVEIAE